ncbi:unnamed protein product [Polarella glacialis]|uniref:CBM1 domain-containing protein n=1 Tax=Polarella glacialis TaxID=89957 RepID=A0A813K500_POLGL|nr:unnamed protein product [Polarella glacialis]
MGTSGVSLSRWVLVLCAAVLVTPGWGWCWGGFGWGDCASSPSSGVSGKTSGQGVEKGTEAGDYDNAFPHGQGSCAGKWQQCGGSTHWYSSFTGGYKGNTTCCEGFICSTSAGMWGLAYWKQCVPKGQTFAPLGDEKDNNDKTSYEPQLLIAADFPPLLLVALGAGVGGVFVVSSLTLLWRRRQDALAEEGGYQGLTASLI